ncbi:hypothetical protein RhiirA4_478212 [Rhizophagus irregularis]|uniref:Uncharacterized protein n=1 Tax=Rhizophagus irregularis TaxID=588596 RepID=A0A2I1HEE8_9GLOM|nr:hypothetical protein RhiirA4_478212 [Rhizophagus irregularis]
MAFIFNVLIVPKVKYNTQLILLTDIDCDRLIAPLRIMFKNKLGLAKTAPNVLIYMKENIKLLKERSFNIVITSLDDDIEVKGEKLKNKFFDRISEKYAQNLKGDKLMPILANPDAKKFAGTVKNIASRQKVLYGKLFYLDKDVINIVHHNTKNDPEDFNIILNKCDGCI